MREGPRGSPVHSGPGLRGFGWSVALFFPSSPFWVFAFLSESAWSEGAGLSGP